MKKFSKYFLLALVILSAFLFSAKSSFAGGVFLYKHKGYALEKEKYQNRLVLAYKTPLRIDGVLDASIIALNSSLIVNGEIRKNIFSFNTNCRINKGAKVNGYFFSFGGKTSLDKLSSARCFNFLLLHNKMTSNRGFKFFLVYLSFVLLGMFFNFFFIKNFIFIGEYLKNKFWPALFSGLLVPFLLFFLALLFAGTYFGLLFLPALLFIYVFYFFFAFYVLAMFVGEKMVKLFTYRDRPYLEIFWGTSLLYLLLLVWLIGPLLLICLWLAAASAVLKLKFGVR